MDLRAGEQWRATTVFLPSSLSYLLPAARLPPIIVVREAGRICTVGGEAGPGAEDASFAVAGPPSPAATVWPLSTVCAACVHRANTTRRG